MSRRSQEGLGRLCHIFVMGNADEWADDVVGDFNGTSICASVGEDFAKCSWPVAVKVSLEAKTEDVVKHLRNLADSIEASGLPHVDPDRVGLEPKPPPLEGPFEEF